MTRQEHIEWCKKRAYEYIDNGDVMGAYSSMTSDMQKHPETINHAAIGLGIQLLMIGKLNTPNEMRKFIEGFN